MSEQTEISEIVSILKELGRIAEHASLSGAFEDGGPSLARKYNSIFKLAESKNYVMQGVFSPVSETASMAEVGIEAKLLASSLESRNKKEGASAAADPSLLVRLAPFVESEDLSDLIRRQIQSGTSFSADIIASIAPFVESKALGELLRSATDIAPTPPEPPKPPLAEVPPVPEPVTMSIPKKSREELVALLENPHLSREQKMEIAMELADLADQSPELTD